MSGQVGLYYFSVAPTVSGQPRQGARRTTKSWPGTGGLSRVMGSNAGVVPPAGGLGPRDPRHEDDRPLVYLDNASTAHPKPSAVVRDMARYMNEIGASPGRGGHLRCLRPLDVDTVVASVQRTRRLVVVDEAPSMLSFGWWLCSTTVDRAPGLLSPPRCVTAADAHVAYAPRGVARGVIPRPEDVRRSCVSWSLPARPRGHRAQKGRGCETPCHIHAETAV
ncbi:MAG TPA: transketolase C-terminal domain-containing protein [Kribbellaceae bacterium]|nr:transketolase C-terminal domain-containing protein [Kribbellaceae bacterium]